jgi:hypothetical protein
VCFLTCHPASQLVWETVLVTFLIGVSKLKEEGFILLMVSEDLLQHGRVSISEQLTSWKPGGRERKYREGSGEDIIPRTHPQVTYFPQLGPTS